MRDFLNSNPTGSMLRATYSRARSSTARILFACGCLVLFGGTAFGEDPSELKAYLRKSTEWSFPSLEKDVDLNIYYIGKSTHSRPWNIGSPVIVYVKNHGHERIGTESDASILMDYIKQYYIVITLDFKNDPKAVSPVFDKDLHRLFRSIYDDMDVKVFEGVNLTPRKFRCFFLPAGCRVATDLVYWELDKHGANGTLDYIMEYYNKRIAGTVTGKEVVSDPSEMTDRQGRPFQYKLAMDLIYPSHADKKVPLIFWASTQVTRHPTHTPSIYRPHMLGFTQRGYAYAIFDHCYNPVRRHFWYTSSSYSLNHWNGLAASTAAIRFLRAHAEEYNIDERYIGGMGHSKGQYSVTRLSDLNHESGTENKQFKGATPGSPEPQPWPGYSSKITAGYQSPGSHAEYLTKEYVPTLVAHGGKDHFAKEGYKDFFSKLETFDINHVALLMGDVAHDLPRGYDEELGIDRYALVHSFFDQYLRVEETLPPTLLYMTPSDQSTDIDPSAPIVFQFAPVMNEESVVRGIQILDEKGKSIPGTWETSRQGALFTFTPKEMFAAGGKIKTVVPTRVKNKSGTPLAEARTTQFTIRR
jgi:hypothetical protein